MDHYIEGEIPYGTKRISTRLVITDSMPKRIVTCTP